MYSLVNNEMNGSKKKVKLQKFKLMDTSKIINSVIKKKKKQNNDDDDDKGKKLNDNKAMIFTIYTRK